MTAHAEPAEPYLKYALFCKDTETDDADELTFRGVIDLVELPPPSEPPGPDSPVLAQLDVNLAFCIAGAAPGRHHLMVGIKAPGIPLDIPPAQTIDWEGGHPLSAVDKSVPYPGAAGRSAYRGHYAGRRAVGRSQFLGALCPITPRRQL